mmetsp:Transcript_36935/g.71578  ORF Transcript_36935/g.71578 Transcript_36935/m.71578 type:complete len:103 (-) Transcript_36935:161-469(-)
MQGRGPGEGKQGRTVEVQTRNSKIDVLNEVFHVFMTNVWINASWTNAWQTHVWTNAFSINAFWINVFSTNEYWSKGLPINACMRSRKQESPLFFGTLACAQT